MATLEPDLLYEFGGFRLEPGRRALCGPDGANVSLPPRAYEALCLLVAHRGTLVEKSTLIGALWPGVFVDENNLAQCISALRRAFAELPGTHRFIATVAGRGYQFVAPVEMRGLDPRLSVAVMPFANLSEDPSTNYIADGIADELIHTFTSLGTFNVPARTSSFAYRGRQIDVRRIAAELNVAAVLEGSVRLVNEQLQVVVQLIDGTSGFTRWSDTYRRHKNELIRLQQDVAEAAVRALTRSSMPLSAAWPDPPTRDPVAYELFLQGQSFATRPNPQNLARATEMFSQAIVRDPGFARAYLGLAYSQHLGVVFHVGERDALAQCERNAQRALSLEPRLALGHALLGAANAHGAKWTESLHHFDAALQIDARDPQIVLPYVFNLLITPGYLRRALETLREAYTFSPSLAGLPAALAMVNMLLGLDSEAQRYAELAVTLGWSKTVGPISDTLSILAVRSGAIDEAYSLMIEDLPRGLGADVAAPALRLVFEAMREPSLAKTAVAALDTFERSVDAFVLDRPMRQRLILWNAGLGDLDAAFATANRSLDHFASLGTIGTVWGTLWLPEMERFRTDLRFAAFTQRLGLPDHWARQGRPDAAT